MARLKNLHNDELAALLIAIGCVMLENSLLFGAALDGESKRTISNRVLRELDDNISRDRADEIAEMTEDDVTGALADASIPAS